MLKCCSCERVFDIPDTIEEYRGEFWGMPAYETMSVCPYCGNDEIEEIQYSFEQEEV